MFNKFSSLSIILVFILSSQFSVSQSIKHPVIWVTQDEKPHILKLIEEYDWAKSMLNDLHDAVDKKVDAHQNNPMAILSAIPKIPANNTLTEFEAVTVDEHTAILNDASYAAMLYFLTENEKYAQFSADILWNYAAKLSQRTPENTTICGNHFYDPRTAYAHFALAYDFIYNFLDHPDTKVFKESAKKNGGL